MFDGELKINEGAKTRLSSYVTKEEVKHNLNLTTDETYDDVFVDSLILAATDEAESYTDHHFSLCKYIDLYYNYEGEYFEISKNPFNELTLLESSEDGITWTPIADTDYVVLPYKSRFQVWFLESKTYTQMRITYTVGYSSEKLPDNARRAIILKASDMYDIERSDYSNKTVNNQVFKQELGDFMNFRW